MRGAFVRNSTLHIALSTATSMVAISAPLAGNQLNRAQVIFVLTLTSTSISAFRLLLGNDRHDSRHTFVTRMLAPRHQMDHELQGWFVNEILPHQTA
jgi:hypothetical protein